MTTMVKVSAAVGSTLLIAAVFTWHPLAAGEGRYKKMPDGSCVWDGRDNGPDQCRPSGQKPKGRYKLDGNKRCYWEPNDDGPNQCEPPK